MFCKFDKPVQGLKHSVNKQDIFLSAVQRVCQNHSKELFHETEFKIRERSDPRSHTLVAEKTKLALVHPLVTTSPYATGDKLSVQGHMFDRLNLG